MEFTQLQTAWMVVLGGCSSVIVLAGAAAAIVKLWRWAHRQSDDNTVSIEAIQKYLASDKRRIEALENRQAVAEEESKLVLLGIMQLMTHEIDGNHIDQLESTRDEIQRFLISKVGGR